ncbi:hypothetical protein ILUMI_14202, partial [Ignelater luminosus]
SISPGYVKTEIVEANLKGSGLTTSPELEAFVKNFPAGLEAEDIAEAVLYVLATPPHVQ